METFDPNEHCPKCGDGDLAQLHYGWQTRYKGGFKGVYDGHEMHGPDELECRCGKCGFIHIRACLDAKV